VAAQVAWAPVQSAPPNAARQAVAYDAMRDRLVVFGGQDHHSGVWFDQTWERGAGRWSLMPTVLHPAARTAAAVAYDSTRGRVVMFGGYTTGWVDLNDTWEWDGGSWVQASPLLPAPSVRAHASMAYHARTARAVLFGGRLSSDGRPLGDTWTYDGRVWTQAQVSVAPEARYYHAMTYDSARERVVLVGGQSGGGQLGDTWEWDGSAWHRMTPAVQPSPRRLAGLAYDAARAVSVLFGGRGAGATYDEIWEWDGTSWTARASATRPSPREGVAMVYDSARQRCVLYGGADDLANDLWEWDGTNWTEISSGTPTVRQGAALAFDFLRGRGLLFGGHVYPQGGTAESWEYDRGAWRRLAPTSAPSARTGAAMTFSTADRGIVVFGGEIGLQPIADTWTFAGGQWRPGPVGPGARTGHAMAESAAGALLFGGVFGGTFLSDTWTFAGQWRLLRPTIEPAARSQHAMAFDSRRARTVLFGGLTGGVALSDTWEFDGQNWVRTAFHSPSFFAEREEAGGVELRAGR
jgi:hypothetical protein